jgi:hypothetical protein
MLVTYLPCSLNFFFLLINLPTNPTIYLYTYLLTYAPTFLPIHYVYLPIYIFYIAKYLINYRFTFSNPAHPPSNPTYQFTKVRPSSWMMNIGLHM